jgi:hypothetical protein
MAAVVAATLVEHAPTVAAEPAVDIAAALALVADTAVAELAADSAAAVTLVADSAAAVTVAADLVAAAMVVAAADTGKFSGFNQKGPSASAGGPFLFVRRPARSNCDRFRVLNIRWESVAERSAVWASLDSG